MPATRKRSRTQHHSGGSGTRKTAQRKTADAPRRRTKASGSKHRVAGGTRQGSPPKGRSSRTAARKTTRASNRTRAALAGEAEKVIAHKRPRASVLGDSMSEDEIYGVALSQAKRNGESTPAMAPKRTRNTRSIEPKSVPPTGRAKARKRR